MDPTGAVVDKEVLESNLPAYLRETSRQGQRGSPGYRRNGALLLHELVDLVADFAGEGEEGFALRGGFEVEVAEGQEVVVEGEELGFGVGD